MTEIQQNRYDRLIRRVANIVGGGSQVNDTLNELFPTIDVENVPAELLALANMRLGWCSSRLAASVGDRNHHQLFNPVGSQAMLIVTSVWPHSVTATTTFRLGTFIGELTTLTGNERRRDTRAGVLASLVGQNRTDQSATLGSLDFRIIAQANTTPIISDSNDIAILFPGTGLTVSTEELNVMSIVSFLWRERIFEPSEAVD